MLIKFGAIITDGRGSLGGHVMSRNTYGAIMRTKVTPVNRSTTLQQNVRSSLTAIAQLWRSITDAQRAAWGSLAQEVSRTNIFGDSVKLTPFNLFIRLNRNLNAIGVSPISDAPALPTSVSVLSLTLTAKVAAGLVSLAYTLSAAGTGNHLLIQATPQVSAGISFVKSEYRQLVTIAATAASPYVATASYAAMFGAPVLGKRIFVKAKVVNDASGFDSVATQTSTIVLAT